MKEVRRFSAIEVLSLYIILSNISVFRITEGNIYHIQLSFFAHNEYDVFDWEKIYSCSTFGNMS